MLRRLVVTFLVVTALTGATSAAQELSTSPATVTSLGEAVISRPPDRVIIMFATEARGQSPQEAQARGASAMTAVQRALETLKLPGGHVMTSGLHLSEDYDFSNNQRVRRGYIDRHNVVVRFDDVGRAGEVITVATGAGATSIGGVGFDRRDREALEEEALKAAVGVARARAHALAAGAGLTVDRIVTITEERAAMSAAGSNAGIRYATRDAVMVEGGSVPVASGEIEIRMRVLLTATLK
jgi:uncharacterized protein YggE